MLVKKITPPLFQPYLIREENRAFIEGRSNKVFTPYSGSILLLLFVIPIGVFSPLSIITFILTLGTRYNEWIEVSSLIYRSDIYMLLYFSFFTLIFNGFLIILLIGAIYSVRMDWIFKYRKSEIIQGTLVSASAEEDSDNNLKVTFNYDFNTPDGRKITNSITEFRNDLKDKKLPPNGTQLAVLYINDKIYTLL